MIKDEAHISLFGYTQTAGRVFAIAAAIAFLSAPLLHATVEHTHSHMDGAHAGNDFASLCAAEFGAGHCPMQGDPESGSEGAVWTSLHQGAKRSDEKILLLIALLTISIVAHTIVSGFVTLHVRIPRGHSLVRRYVSPETPDARFCRRGIAQYRAFP